MSETDPPRPCPICYSWPLRPESPEPILEEWHGQRISHHPECGMLLGPAGYHPPQKEEEAHA